MLKYQQHSSTIVGPETLDRYFELKQTIVTFNFKQKVSKAVESHNLTVLCNYYVSFKY